MAAAQILNLTHAVDSKATHVGNKLKEVDDKMDVLIKDAKDAKAALDAVQWIQLRESLRRWFNPPDPSIITTSHATFTMGERLSGFLKTALLKNGGPLAVSCGSTANLALERASFVLLSSKKSHSYARQGRPSWRTFISISGTLISNTVATSSPLSSSKFLLSPVIVATSSLAFIRRTTTAHKSRAIALSQGYDRDSPSTACVHYIGRARRVSKLAWDPISSRTGSCACQGSRRASSPASSFMCHQPTGVRYSSYSDAFDTSPGVSSRSKRAEERYR